MPGPSTSPNQPAAKEKKLISETNLGSAVYGTPIVANGAVYLQSNTHLLAFSDPTKTGALKDEPQKVEIKLGEVNPANGMSAYNAAKELIMQGCQPPGGSSASASEFVARRVPFASKRRRVFYRIWACGPLD